MELDPPKKRRPRKKLQTGIANPRSTKALNITISATLSYGLACPSAENHWTTDLGRRSQRLTRDEISDSDNLLFLQPSSIVASFSDPWRLDFFGAIRNVTSLFSRICFGAKELREARRQSSNQRIENTSESKNKWKNWIGLAQLNNQVSGIFENIKKLKGHTSKNASILEP